MKEVWVLSVRTSLPEVCENSNDLETNFMVFDSFEKGRDEFRKIVKEYAFSENAMFDGKGDIIYLREYANDAFEPEEDDFEEFLDNVKWDYISNSLQKACCGENIDFKMEFEKYFDGMISVTTDGDEIKIYGDESGPINGYDPYIKTNIFSMKEEKDYYLYIDDMFKQDYSSELYIDLKKAEIK